jgi:hypothetical protein
MAFPVGMQTCVVTFGTSLSWSGQAAAMQIQVEPTHDLVWASTGQPLIAFAETVTVAAGIPGQIILPVTNQSGFINAAGQAFTGWAYQITITYSFGNQTHRSVKSIQPLVGQTLIDLDMVPEGTITAGVAATIPPVISVNGQTGAVVVSGGAGLDLEQVRDAIGAALVAGSLITITVNDAGDTITIDTTATQNSTDAYLLDRTHHTGLQAQTTVTGLVAALSNKADLVAGLIPTSQLPPLAISEVFVVGSQAAMLALTAQRGDVAVRTDNGLSYILATDSPGTLADWKSIGGAGGGVVSVAGKTGTVLLVKADVGLGNVDNTSDVNKPISTAVQDALNNKLGAGDPIDSNNLTNPIPQDSWPSGGALWVDYVKSGGVHGSANAWPTSRPAVDGVLAKGPNSAGPPTWLQDGDDFDTVG